MRFEIPPESPKLGRDGRLDDDAWPLLPGEFLEWTGAPTRVSPPLGLITAGLLSLSISIVSFCFAGILAESDLIGVPQALGIGTVFFAAALAFYAYSGARLEGVRYAVTNLRVIRLGQRGVRFAERRAITFGRIRWHHSSAVVGDLEMVVATPFGPLARTLRVVFNDVHEPDLLWASICGRELGRGAGDVHGHIRDRLGQDETLIWEGRPEGLHVGWRELWVTTFGFVLTLFSALYIWTNVGFMAALEGEGLAIGSPGWLFLFSAVVIAWVSILTVGLSLIHRGVIRARRLGRASIYALTNERLIIRRGRSELSIERNRIVDVVIKRTALGLFHVFLMLDGPGAKAVNLSGAIGGTIPSRDVVPPVLFDLRDTQEIAAQLTA